VGSFFIGAYKLEAVLPWQYGLAHDKMPLTAFYQRKRRSSPASKGSVSTPQRADGNECPKMNFSIEKIKK
jgi:hypothetical protein